MSAGGTDRRSHWEKVWAEKDELEVSWHQPHPRPSLELLEPILGPDSGVIDVGGGTSRLVDVLLERGVGQVSVLDISGSALERSKSRLGEAAAKVQWIHDDVVSWWPDEVSFDVWHDRAVFHFLTDPHDRERYVASVSRAVKPGGHAVIASFAEDGPEKCSGLTVARYSPEQLAEVFSEHFELEASGRDEHETPRGSVQKFTFVRLRRK